MTPDIRTAEGLERILAVVRAAAREAAALAATGFRANPVVAHKGAVDLVTEFDHRSEELLREHLSRALPFAIVGEEHGKTEGREGQSAAGPAFYVDPVDGTTNFVHGHPFWCVSIGLVEGGTPILGVVVAPALGVEWFGWTAPSGERRAVRRSSGNAVLADRDARTVPLTEEACAVSATPRFEDSLLATGFPYDRRTSAENNFDAFVAIKRRCRAVRRCGSAALDLCLVADGTYEGYWERKLNAWDIAAGAALVRAAGGRVTEFDGSGAFLASGHVVASNGVIHEALLEELESVVPASLRPQHPR